MNDRPGGMWARIPNPAWAAGLWLDGELMACATHEVFFCDLSPLAQAATALYLRVLPTQQER